MMKTLALISTLVLAACGSDSTPAKMDAPKMGSDAPSGSATLTVKNYLSWCSVTVGSGAAATSATQNVPITAGGMVTLKASPASATFEVSGNMWHHVDGDGGSGVPGTVTGTGTTAVSTTTVTTVTGTSKCVWVCCPFSSSHSGCDPASIGEQCP